jgi:hypothetical protein
LERWRTLEVAAHTLKRWHTLLPLEFDLTHVGMWGEVAALSLTFGSLLLPLGAPSLKMPCAPLLGNSTHLFKV